MFAAGCLGDPGCTGGHAGTGGRADGGNQADRGILEPVPGIQAPVPRRMVARSGPRAPLAQWGPLETPDGTHQRNPVSSAPQTPRLGPPSAITASEVHPGRQLSRRGLFLEPQVADREGFEPSVPMKVHTLSKRAHSTTLTSVLCILQLRLCGERALLCALDRKRQAEFGALLRAFYDFAFPSPHCGRLERPENDPQLPAAWRLTHRGSGISVWADSLMAR